MTPFNSFLISIVLISIIGVLFILGRTPIKLGQVINEPYFCQGGLCEYSYRVPLKASTNTPCSIKAPEATSTIIHASWDIRTATSVAMMLEIGWSNNTGATTTSLASSTMSANSRQTLIATSTLQGFYPFSIPLTNHIIPGSLNATNSSYVNFKFGTSMPYIAGSTTPTGNCEVIFKIVS